MASDRGVVRRRRWTARPAHGVRAATCQCRLTLQEEIARVAGWFASPRTDARLNLPRSSPVSSFDAGDVHSGPGRTLGADGETTRTGRYCAPMRRMLLLLATAGLLALHHGVPMADASSGMAGDHGSSKSAAMSLLCAGVVAAAFEVLRRLAVRGSRGWARGRVRTSGRLGMRAMVVWRGRPPPRSTSLTLLCVNRR